MSIKSLFLASIAGGAAYVLIQAVRAQRPDNQPQVVYVNQPGASGQSGGNKWVPFLDLALGLMDGNTQQPIFADAGSGLGDLLGGLTGGSTSTGGGQDVGGLLDVIARYESGGDYNIVYGGSRIQPPRPITQMTVQEVRNWQDQSVAAGSKSSAVGKYQIIRKTMDQIIAGGALRRSELFGPAAQDRAAMFLLNRRGLSQYQNGQISETTFAQRLSQEWASLPAATQDRNGNPAQGQSYYAGDGLNRAHIDLQSVLSAIRGIA